MRAITITEYADPPALELADAPDLEPGPGEALLEVHAAGVNRADLLQARGHYPPPPGASPILGVECSGRILGFGPPGESARPDEPAQPARGGFEVGDEVCALLAGGAYAERVVVPTEQLLPVPAGVSLTDAAALPEAICTVWSNLVMLAHLRSGETLLVHGGASGIGTTAIQLGKTFGARVIVTVGSAAKAERCRELGADEAIEYPSQDFAEEVRRITEGSGVDVILDIIGAAYLEPNVASLAVGGRLVVIGLQKGGRAELDLGALMTKRAAILGTTLRGRPAAEKAAIVRDVVQYAWPLVAAGRIRPVVDREFPIARAAEALGALDGDHVGKLLLRI